MTEYEEKNSILGEAFDRYVLENEEFAAQIPVGAYIVIQLEGDEEFNTWARGLTESHAASEGIPIVYVHVKGVKTFPSSRLIDPVIKKIA